MNASLVETLPSGERREVTKPVGILFRAPTHLRESSGHRHAPEELLARHQWAAFGRALTVFTDAQWVNHPMYTFAAESKPFQLRTAARIGLRVPRTVVANHLPPPATDPLVVKALDSFLLRDHGKDLFFYTTAVTSDDLGVADLQAMPVVLQEAIAPKIDVRVTVVGDQCFVAETASVVDGDWRLRKSYVRFKRAELPMPVEEKCVRLLRALGLRYGAIDFVKRDDEYYFLEINPTGEWSWIDDLFDGGIARALSAILVEDK